jgi:hypothetical protein
MADDVLGESNIAAGSPFSALCMAWKNIIKELLD